MHVAVLVEPTEELLAQMRTSGSERKDVDCFLKSIFSWQKICMAKGYVTSKLLGSLHVSRIHVIFHLPPQLLLLHIRQDVALRGGDPFSCGFATLTLHACLSKS